MAHCANCNKRLHAPSDGREIPPVAYCSAACKARYLRSRTWEEKTLPFFFAGIAAAFLCCVLGMFFLSDRLPAVGCAVCAVTLLAFPYLTDFLDRPLGLRWSRLLCRALGLVLLVLAGLSLIY